MSECLAENDVVDLLDGRLSESAVERISTHLDGCDACRRLVADAAREMPVSSPAGASAAVTRGTCVGRYVVTDRIGVGAMGVVYAAYDPELNRRVALKLLRADAFASVHTPGELRKRLVHEARALAQLSHPNVMTIYDVGTHEGEVFLAMEFVEGGTLGEWLAAEKRSQDAIIEVFRQAGEGLAAAHAAGIVHRDFKPDNVLLGKDGRTRVSDFGLAHGSGAAAPPAADGGPSSAGPLSARATRTGALVGTPAYMAPEQWQGRASDARTDVFAFSVALYEALQGERPFAGTTAEELSAAVAKNEMRPARVAMPASVRRALLRGLRASPDERYASMRAMLDDLAPPASKRPTFVIAIAAALAIAAGALAVRRSHAPACGSAASDWGDAFDQHSADAVRDALARTNNPAHAFAFTTIERTLQQYRDAWVAMRTEACEATRVRGAQSEALLDARMRCLDERRRGVKAYVESVAHGETDGLVERATTAAANLPRVDDCGDTRALSAPMPLPSDPTKRARLEALGIRAAEIESEALGAKEALAALAPVEQEAGDIAYAPLVARLAYDHALFTSRLRDNRRAEIELQRAAVAGEAAHTDGIVTDAWIRLVFVIGYQGNRIEEGELWARYAAAAIERSGGDERRQALLDSNIGIMLLNDETRLDEVRQRFERSLETTRKLDGETSQSYARALSRMSMVLFTLARSAEAIPYEQKGRSALERIYGPEGIDVAVSLGNEGEEVLDTGQVDAAIPLLERSARMQERFSRNDSSVLCVLARALRAKGKPAEALEVDRRALAVSEKNEPEGAYGLAMPTVGIALDLLDLGRAAEALPYAERGVTLRTVAPAASERGEARFVLARALDGAGDHARARELADLARADDSKTAERYGGRYAAALRDVDAWISARKK